MYLSTTSVRTFPSVSIPSHCGGLPVEVALIAQLGHGSGDQLVESASARQRAHSAFVDALDEPSARLGGVDLARGDASSLYTFTVGSQGHPFHRHAGHRVFTAISGSGGTRLCFSSASQVQLDADPNQFLKALSYVDIPPDSLFTVRFGSGTWHRFVPLKTRSPHPALFALSCHTNELGGELPDHLRATVAANQADIPALTELLPDVVNALLASAAFDASRIPTYALSLDAPAASLASTLCAWMRGTLGRLRGAWGRWRGPVGFLADNGAGRRSVTASTPPADSLLQRQFGQGFEHEDTFVLVTDPGELAASSASTALVAVLDGFLDNRPAGVSRLMALRNVLVRPLGLRESPLGCPVSSLLAARSEHWFAGRFPVLEQRVDAADRRAQVVLGADDRHLAFRSCVGVCLRPDGCAEFTLGTRVRTNNLFGRFYLGAIDRVHRGYITPTMLRLAVDHAVRSLRAAPLQSTAGLAVRQGLNRHDPRTRQLASTRVTWSAVFGRHR